MIRWMWQEATRAYHFRGETEENHKHVQHIQSQRYTIDEFARMKHKY
jgi:hypothetical protein